MEKYIDDRNIHDGHRGRMRAKLLEHGQRIFDTYELLEMLLYQVVPYKDTNPIAKRLLYAFGGLDGVFKAEKKELTGVSGVGEKTADFLISVGRLSSIIGAEILPKAQYNFRNYDTVGEFFVQFFAKSEEKCVVAAFLDNNMNLIEVKRLYDVDYDSGGVRATAFIGEALKNHASVIISAHNHPHGPFYPTPGDRATNNAITSALEMVGLIHAEHYIVCGDSYAGIGSLKNFSRGFSQTPALDEFMIGKARAGGSLVSALSAERAESEPIYENGYNRRDFDYFASLLSLVSDGDGRDAAHALLSTYQTIENTICAPAEKLRALINEKAAFFIKLLGYIVSRRKTDAFTFGEKYNRAEIAEYLKAVFIGESVEKIYLLTFDENDRLTGCKLLGEGTVSASEVIPRKAAEVAVASSAHTVAIAHNHPFGNPTPSNDDIKFTNVFEMLFSSCGIGFSGHYIIAGQRSEIIISEMLEAGSKKG